MRSAFRRVHGLKRGPTQLRLLLRFVSRHCLGQLFRELRESLPLCRCSLRVLPAVSVVVCVLVRWC